VLGETSHLGDLARSDARIEHVLFRGEGSRPIDEVRGRREPQGFVLEQTTYSGHEGPFPKICEGPFDMIPALLQRDPSHDGPHTGRRGERRHPIHFSEGLVGSALGLDEGVRTLRARALRCGGKLVVLEEVGIPQVQVRVEDSGGGRFVGLGESVTLTHRVRLRRGDVHGSR